DLAGPDLLVRTGSKAGQKIPLTKSRYTLGRNSSNDIVLEDQSVSGRHAVLIKTDGGWKIEDAESTNGTSINGEAVMGGQLHHSDRVRLGSIKLAYIVPSEQALRDSERLESGGFDPNATVQTHAIQRPKEWGNLYWIGGGVAALLLVVVIYMLLPSGNNELPALAPITEPLSASPLWERQLPSGRSYPTAPLLADVNGDGYLDTVTADGGGHLLVLDGEEGKMIFDLPFAGRVVGSAVAGDLTGDGIDDLIVASFEGVISAVNGKAQLLWKTGAGSGYGAIYTRPEIADLDGNGVPEIVIATGNKGLVALDSTNGQELWNSAALGLVGVREIPLVVDLNGDGSLELVATTDAGVVWALAANIQSAAVHWQRELPEGALSAPVLAASEEGPLVVVASSTSGVYALFANSGLISWRHSAQTESTMTPIVTADAAGAQRLLVTADSGQVMALSVEGGELLWRQETGDRVVANGASIDLSNDQLPDLVLVGQSGLLSVLDMDDGQLLLTTRINQESAVLVSPVIGDINNDQLAEIVVASQQGSISALTLNRTLTAGSAPWAKNLHRRSIIASE
ncbi:MAG: PQQ-binding-like beta-propeller repeat protein, partial [Gammaproteobacteria bacterium]